MMLFAMYLIKGNLTFFQNQLQLTDLCAGLTDL